MEKVLIGSFLIGFIGLFYWALKTSLKTVNKDWETVEYFKKRCNEVKTKQEIADLHKEFVDEARKIYNSQITPELTKIDGYY